MTDLLAGLNPSQREAVVAGDGALLILAGAGSGKTRTLIHRVAYLIRERGVAPYEIMAVTFTNKAAGEMRERLARLLGPAESPWVATFHASCVRILRQEAAHLGFGRDFTIYDDQDQQRLLKSCLDELNIGERTLKPRGAAVFIDGAKNRGLGPEEARADDSHGGLCTQVYALYQQRLKQANAMDFGDLLLHLVRLFDQQPAVRQRWASRFRYVLVDEFQDTNSVQYDLTRQLVSVHGNLCVVGDDDQSIYRWRGADIGNILGFERDFAPCTVIRLEQNYRSTQTILEAANEVVGRNAGRKGKRLWTENPVGEPIRLETLNDDLEESRFIADEIGRLQAQGRKLRDVAIFYRTNAQSRSLEEALAGRRLPYAVFGGLKFFARMEIKDILAYLRILANPADAVSARRIINVPARGIGKTTVDRIAQEQDAAGGFLEACQRTVEQRLVGPGPARKIAAFLELIASFRARMDSLPYPELTKVIIEETGYGPELSAERSEEARDRLQNLQELVNGMEEHRGVDTTLQDYLEQVALVTDMDSYDPALDRVTLMTLHAAKGLEFPVVFMAGMEDGLFPHSRAAMGGDELEEERRLCYVGMTRAMERLILTHARRRRMYGSFQFNPPSPFLGEVPTHLLRAPAAKAASGSGHNLASLFSPQTAAVPSYDEFDQRPPEEQAAAPAPDHNLAAVARAKPTPAVAEVRLVPEAEEGVRLGMNVRHVKFGEGVVRKIEGSGDATKVIVYFPRAGYKKLMLKFAGLEPA